jgi:hypothetical protein
MGKNKPEGKAKGKGSQLVIRIDKAERAAFVSLCEDLDTSAAREIRRFMRSFVAAHAQKQQDTGAETQDVATPTVDLPPVVPGDAAAAPLQPGPDAPAEPVSGTPQVP